MAARALTVLGWHARAYRRTWRATVTVAFLSPVFFLVSVGVLLGKLVDRGNANLGGLSYLEFVAPGLLAATAMQIGTNEGSFPVLAGLKWNRTYHAVVATPVRIGELVGGVLAWVSVRVLLGASVFAAVAGAFSSPLAVLTPFAALLCGLSFGSLMIVLASRVDSHFVLTAVLRFVVLPLFLFSGTFFPVSQLPGWLEPVAWVTPLWHGVSLCRDLADGRAELWPSLGHVAYLLGVTAAGATLATVFLRRRLLR